MHLVQGFFFGSDTLIAPGNLVPRGLEQLLPELEAYMDAARGACVHVMRAIAGTGLLTHLVRACRMNMVTYRCLYVLSLR